MVHNMLDSLYEKALRKKDSINKKISTDFDNLEVDPSKDWNRISYTRKGY